jgi:hypothetical protein
VWLLVQFVRTGRKLVTLLQTRSTNKSQPRDIPAA